MESIDVNFSVGENRFNYRVAAIIECGDKVILDKSKEVDFWNLPGGRVKIDEDTFSALKREMKEEIGFEITCEPTLVAIIENFYEMWGKKVSELDFIYKIEIGKDDELAKKQNFESFDNPSIIYHWFNKSDVKNQKCLPKTIYELVERKDDNFKHIIIK